MFNLFKTKLLSYFFRLLCAVLNSHRLHSHDFLGCELVIDALNTKIKRTCMFYKLHSPLCTVCYFFLLILESANVMIIDNYCSGDLATVKQNTAAGFVSAQFLV